MSNVKWVKGLDNLDYPHYGLHLVCTDSGRYFWVHYDGGVVQYVFRQPERFRLGNDSHHYMREEAKVRLCTPDNRLHKVAMASLDPDSTLSHVDDEQRRSVLSSVQRFPSSYLLKQTEYISERQQKINELKAKLAELEALENNGGEQ